MHPFLKLVLDALHEARDDVRKSLASLGEAPRALHRNDKRADLKALFAWKAEALGEYALNEMRNVSNANPDTRVGVGLVVAALDASYDLGYKQACEDLHSTTEAYLKGLN